MRDTNSANAIEFDGAFDLQAIARSRAQEFHCFVSPGFAALAPGFMPLSASRTCSEFPKSLRTSIVETDPVLAER